MQHLLVLMQLVHVVTVGFRVCPKSDVRFKLCDSQRYAPVGILLLQFYVIYLFNFSFKIGAGGGAVC